LANISYEHRVNAWYESLNYSHEDGNFIYVAEDELGEIVGFADGGAERTHDPIYKGELYAIYILQTHQRKGLGRCLVQTITEKLSRLEINSMLVWALADNSACQFYLELGGKQVYEQELKIGRKALIEKAYGWIDTANLRIC
jgi:GNAT superfamily N-acetyltransferase